MIFMIPKRLAGTMLLKCLTLLALSITPAAYASDAGMPTCALKEAASLNVELSSNGAVLIPVSINGTTVHMILDTSAPASVIEQTAAERLLLGRHIVPLRTPDLSYGRARIDEYTVVAEFTLGGLTFRNLQLLMLPRPRDGSPGYVEDIVGIIGMDLFRNVDIELDLAHDKVNLFTTDHCPDADVYWADRYDAVPVKRGALGNVYFIMELEGKKLETSLQTRQGESYLSTDATRALYGWDETAADVTTVKDANGHKISHYRAMALTSGGLAIINANIRLDLLAGGCEGNTRIGYDSLGAARYEGPCVGPYPLILGTRILKQLRLYLATKEEMLYFTAADAHRTAR